MLIRLGALTAIGTIIILGNWTALIDRQIQLKYEMKQSKEVYVPAVVVITQ